MVEARSCGGGGGATAAAAWLVKGRSTAPFGGEKKKGEEMARGQGSSRPRSRSNRLGKIIIIKGRVLNRI